MNCSQAGQPGRRHAEGAAAAPTGVCGSCKCKVVDGEFETASTTPLTAEEIAAGYVLACSGRARSDLTIELG